uniref:Putative secreted protein n=1 Tax=Anopheles darlingi TaxID=43151 RepID=A0A2M4D710_ANODA
MYVVLFFFLLFCLLVYCIWWLGAAIHHLFHWLFLSLSRARARSLYAPTPSPLSISLLHTGFYEAQFHILEVSHPTTSILTHRIISVVWWFSLTNKREHFFAYYPH